MLLFAIFRLQTKHPPSPTTEYKNELVREKTNLTTRYLTTRSLSNSKLIYLPSAGGYLERSTRRNANHKKKKRRKRNPEARQSTKKKKQRRRRRKARVLASASVRTAHRNSNFNHTHNPCMIHTTSSLAPSFAWSMPNTTNPNVRIKHFYRSWQNNCTFFQQQPAKAKTAKSLSSG